MTAAIVRLSPLSVVAGPWVTIPGRVEFNGWRIDAANIGDTDGALKLVDVVYSGVQPTPLHTLNSETPSLNGNTLTITRTWAAPALAVVKAVLKAKLDNDASAQWVSCRGSKAAQIETAFTDGKTSIDAAATAVGAYNAYQAVVWP